ncbi:hypothetical protein [Paenibacillus sp. FSL E2-0178]|uniref:hypothetical protein n=1 Tax=Paenibacillus sp. FSL E2-0178 TaxID=2921361 RepID=UPI0031586AE4
MNKILIIIFSSALLFGNVRSIPFNSFYSTTSVSEENGLGSDLEVLLIERDEVESQILTLESFIDSYKKNQVDKWVNQISNNPNSFLVPEWKEALNDTGEYLKQLKAELATRQQQLADLDAQITALQK